LVAALDPGDVLVEDELAMMTGCMVSSLVALEVRVAQALARLFRVPPKPQVVAVVRRLATESRSTAVPARTAPKPAVDARDSREQEIETSRQPAPAGDAPPPKQYVEVEISEDELAEFPSLNVPELPTPEAVDPAHRPEPETRSPVEAATADAPIAPVEIVMPPVLPDDGTPVSLPTEGDPEMRLAAASQALMGAEMRDDIADILLAYSEPYLARRMLLVARKGSVVGWRGDGEGVDAEAVRAISIPLDEPSVFVGLSQGQSFWLGRLPPMSRNIDISLGLGGDPPSECLILPVILRSKVVCFLYGDNRTGAIGEVPLAALRRLTAKAGLAFQVYLLKSKIRAM
jgi:hypothetical protein